jgi:hypothetical protein
LRVICVIHKPRSKKEDIMELIHADIELISRDDKALARKGYIEIKGEKGK